MNKIIIYIGVALLTTLFSCKDYLDVLSPSKFDAEYLVSSVEDANSLLSAAYSSLTHDYVYGSYIPFRFALNSDVEFSAFSSPPGVVRQNDFKCFDGNKYSSDILNTWQRVYEGIERANLFIQAAEASPLLNGADRDKIRQMIGEAKCIRAMLYYDMVSLFGDIPFRTKSAHGDDNLYIGATDRKEIFAWLINDLKSAAPGMKWASDVTVERASKEFCFGLVARLAITRGGYALYPDKNNPSAVGTMQRASDYKDYYEIARDYADSVIVSGKHQLNKSFRQVFVDQCNYVVNSDDDVIFEIPFLKTYTGRIGYDAGPHVEYRNNVTPHDWGVTSGSGITVSSLYLFSFDDKDLRRDFTVLSWDYDYETTASDASYVPKPYLRAALRMGKWSKLWNTSRYTPAFGANEGINYPYMRYAELLLIYAEAVNELNKGGADDKAKVALKTVRARAFADADRGDMVDSYVDKLTSKEDFFQAIVNERKWEFGGENMRWKDLARWNLYAKVVYDQFKALKVLGWGFLTGGSPDGESLDPMYARFPDVLIYDIVDNPHDIDVYPCLGGSGANNLKIIKFGYWPRKESIFGLKYSVNWGNGYFISGINPHDEVLYSYKGYIYGSKYQEGSYSRPTGGNDMTFNVNNLPPVRYILPIPNLVITTHGGTLQNYYGHL